MAKIRTKGTVLQQEVSSVLTAVAQIVSIDLPDMESESYESDTLDNANAGVPYDSTGRTEGGSAGFEMFFDPALAGHRALLDLLDDPVTYVDQNWNLIFADAGTTNWSFVGAGFGLGGAVALSDGLKATCSIKMDGLPVFPA